MCKFNDLTNKAKVILYVVAAVVLLWTTLAHGNVHSGNSAKIIHSSGNKTIADFDGEKLVYDISFLWFENAAEAVTTMEQDENGCIARLTAETKGFVGFFTGYVKHFYVSYMKMTQEKKGLWPYLFEKNIIFQRSEEKVVTKLDYKKRTLSWVTTEKGKIIEEKSMPIPPSIVYYDILSVLYNFRSMYYGEIEKGKDFVIQTIPEKNESEIRIHVATREEELKLKREENIKDSEGYFLIVKIPKEIFKTKEGRVLVWGSKDLLPLKVIVRDYIGFGDIRATLREKINVKNESL